LALPPDPLESFQREVDENLRRDQLADFGKKYGKWIALGVFLFLVAVGGSLFWQDRVIKKQEAQAEELADIVKDLGAGQKDGADQRLAALAEEGKGATRAAALMASAALKLQSADREGAIAGYKAVAEDDDLPQPYRDLALIRQTLLEIDSNLIQPDAVIARMQPLTVPESPWYGTAGEITASALLKAGRKDEAGKLFAAIAENASVPQSLRERAADVALSLGATVNEGALAPAANQ